jgi:hypothetical protein
MPRIERKTIGDSCVQAHQRSASKADTGHDSIKIKRRSAIAMIPRKSDSAISSANRDWSLYPYRHLMGNVLSP